MQTKTKMMMAAGAAGVLALAGAASLANADMGGRMMGWGPRMGHGNMNMLMMERYDADKDGKLSQAEIDQNRTQWLSEFDADKNTTLSLEEFKNLWLKARNEEMVREFQFFDRDGNAQVTLDEYKQPLAGLVAERDRNRDGFLSKEDRPQRGQRGRHGRGEGRGEDHGMGEGMGQGMGHGMGQGQGPGMMMEEDDAEGNETPPAAPAAPANP